MTQFLVILPQTLSHAVSIKETFLFNVNLHVVSELCECMCVRLTGSVWLHGDSSRGMREHTQSVSCCALLLEGVPLEINTMEVYFSAETKGVPNNLVPGTHL